MEPVGAELERMDSDDGRAEELVRQLSQDPLHRMPFLNIAFDPGSAKREHARIAMTYLVTNNGEWGEKLARAVFLSNRTTMSQKMDAARG